MYISSLHYALWILQAVLQLGLAVFLFRRNLHREYRYFFAYTIAQVIGFAAGFSSNHISYAAYFFSFWITGAIGIGLGFAVIYEVFTKAFEPYKGLRALGSAVFHWVVLVVLLAAAIVAVSTPGSAGNQLVKALLIVERSVRVMQCGMLLFLFLFYTHLGLSWRHHLFGIALGFGLFAGVELTLYTLLAQFRQFTAVFGIVRVLVYDLAVATWLMYVLLPQPAPRQAGVLPDSEKWEFELGIMKPVASEGFLTNMERTVERVLSEREREHRPASA
jgi:hypothetical protein